MKKELMIIADYSQESSLTFQELCEVCDISSDFINALIDYDIIHPAGASPQEWEFALEELERIKTALRLQHDLEVNLPGIAIVLDLMEEIERLRAHTALLERHFMK